MCYSDNIEQLKDELWYAMLTKKNESKSYDSQIEFNRIYNLHNEFKRICDNDINTIKSAIADLYKN